MIIPQPTNIIVPINPQLFREAASHYIRYGSYCRAPKGSRDWEEYWNEEERRCLEGYEAGGKKISGRYYFYLNYFPLMRSPSEDDKKYGKIHKSQKKVLSFADFWEVQHDWFQAKEDAWNRPFGEGNHLACAKTRGCGFSYMDASEGVYNYNFVPKSKSFYLAYLEKYLLGEDGTLLKCWDGLTHLNTKTDGFWLKNRHEINQSMHKRASYLPEGSIDPKGYMSEISGIIVDNPRKVRGARGMKITMEECGSFKDFLKALEALRPLVEEGNEVLGQISAFGTGGEEGEYIEGLEEVFYNPTAHNFAAFDNIWDEEGGNDTIGYFVPAFIATPGFFDENGKPKIEECKEHWNKQFDKKKRSKNNKALDRLKAERPFNTTDVFQRVNSNIFNIYEVKKQLSRVKMNRDIQGLLQHGVMVNTEKGIDFKISNTSKPLLKFPHKDTDDLTGCVTIIERPYRDRFGNVPINLYTFTVDPYYKDDAVDRTSLGAVRVMMRNNNITGTLGNRTVAWFTSRTSLDAFNRTMFMLAEYYNVKIQSEISGGGQGIIDYARSKRKLDMLEYEPEMIHNKEIASKQSNKSYFMNMNTDRKKLGLKYLADWLMEPIAMKETGEVEYNINREYDEAFLTELLKFNDKGNFDRISTMILQMYMLKEKDAIEVEEYTYESGIFNRSLFTDHSSGLDNDVSHLLGLNQPEESTEQEESY